MLTSLTRLTGFCLLALGFAGLVVDGTRSIANSGLSMISLHDLSLQVLPSTLKGLEQALTQRISPIVWDPLMTSLLALPASLVAVGLGTLLLWIARDRPDPLKSSLSF